MTTTVYVAVDVGCIECGESSAVLGVFTDRTTAEEVMEAAQAAQAENWSGQHDFFVQEVVIDHKQEGR